VDKKEKERITKKEQKRDYERMKFTMAMYPNMV
jgi:hypothetical protein